LSLKALSLKDGCH